MYCIKCHSPRIIKFIDGFGDSRVFCKTCQESMLVKDVIIDQKNVWNFSGRGTHIPRRWEDEGNRKIGSFTIPR